MINQIQFGLVQSRFNVRSDQLHPFTRFDIEQQVMASRQRYQITPQFYNTAIHQYNDRFTITTQAKQQNNTGYKTPTLTDEYNAHRAIQNDLKQYYGIKFEPYDLHVVNPWHTETRS